MACLSTKQSQSDCDTSVLNIIACEQAPRTEKPIHRLKISRMIDSMNFRCKLASKSDQQKITVYSFSANGCISFLAFK